MAVYNETETSASNPVHTVHTKTQSIPEVYDCSIKYDESHNFSKKEILR